MNLSQRTAVLLLAGLIASPAGATDINFSGSIINSCTLTLSNGGTMTPDSGYHEIGTQQGGGIAAVLVVASVGAFPTITFGAPLLVSSPGGWVDDSVKEIAYSALIAPSQAYTSAQTSRTLTTNAETFTINGRMTSSAGFAAGAYTMRTVVTCSL